MKKLILALGTVLMLAACSKGKGGGDKFVSSPNSCFNGGYAYNHQTGQYTDAQGRIVNCDQGYYSDLNYFTPHRQVVNGSLYNGCSSWNAVYPGSRYIPMPVAGYGVMCVKTSYFPTIPNWSFHQARFGGYPSYAMNCRVGVDCPARCLGGSVGNIFLGGTLALCW